MTSEIYKISASLLNSWIYYENNKSEKNFNDFMKSLKGEFKTNRWIKRGNKFESEVFEGKHDKLSKLVSDLPKQRWCSRTIKIDGIDIKISGKLDVIDDSKKRIYDIKRVNEFSEDKYDTSFQHLLYFYLNPDIEDFYYLVASGETNENIEFNVIHKKRPENIETIVFSGIRRFFDFLKANDLWTTYTEFQKTKGKSNEQKDK